MKLAIKLPLLALLYLAGAEVTIGRQALAGRASVLPPDSSGAGVSDTFSYPEFSNRSKLTCTNNGVVNTLRDIRQSESVPSVSGKDLSISPSQVESIQSLIAGDRPQ